jgi:hypothetical protein
VKLAYEYTDTEIRIMGIQVLFRELGCVNALRFITQMQHGPEDYLKLQEELFKNMSVDEIYTRAKKHFFDTNIK